MIIHPIKEIRANYTERTLTVYQAYSPAIADPAIAHQHFVHPFKIDRMTWIKPSFLWTMYRTGWGTKTGQEKVLAIQITRDGFEWALGRACLSNFEKNIHNCYEDWQRQIKNSFVRVQWDPERNLHLAPLNYRTIQIGLSGEAVHRYVNEWIVSITPINDNIREITTHLQAGKIEAARMLLPLESEYPYPKYLSDRLGIDNQYRNLL